MRIIFLTVSFLASVIGSICGIGGGTIIKPVLDSLNIMNVNTISFLSGSTVLSMTIVSLLKSKFEKNKNNEINYSIVVPLSIGAILGGIIGKQIFVMLKTYLGSENYVGFIQSLTMSIIILVTISIVLRMRKGKKFEARYKENVLQTLSIGLILGVSSSFLGIGGGPINIIVLTIFFLMSSREAALNNLFIIMFSQLSSIIFIIASNSMPDFDTVILGLMVLGGVAGGLLGTKYRNILSNNAIEKLFLILLIVILGINISNLFRFYYS